MGPCATIDADRGWSIERMYGSEGWGFESLQAHSQILSAAGILAGRADLGSRSIPLTVPSTQVIDLLTTSCARSARSLVWGMRRKRGGGSMRQRRPGVWEVRVAVGRDPVSGRSQYRSLTVHGDREGAQGGPGTVGGEGRAGAVSGPGPTRCHDRGPVAGMAGDRPWVAAIYDRRVSVGGAIPRPGTGCHAAGR